MDENKGRLKTVEHLTEMIAQQNSTMKDLRSDSKKSTNVKCKQPYRLLKQSQGDLQGRPQTSRRFKRCNMYISFVAGKIDSSNFETKLTKMLRREKRCPAAAPTTVVESWGRKKYRWKFQRRWKGKSQLRESGANRLAITPATDQTIKRQEATANTTPTRWMVKNYSKQSYKYRKEYPQKRLRTISWGLTSVHKLKNRRTKQEMLLVLAPQAQASLFKVQGCSSYVVKVEIRRYSRSSRSTTATDSVMNKTDGLHNPSTQVYATP